MSSSAALSMTTKVGTLDINRLLIGMWQLSSPAWGSASRDSIVADMKKHFDAGYRTFDMADHYGDAELIWGQFRKTLSANEQSKLVGCTKWCIMGSGRMTRPVVETAIRQRLQRMGVDSLDMLQFHWGDYGNPAYLTALKIMKDLQSEGLIKNISLTNFDSKRLTEIIEAGIPIASNQVQFSLIDLRPEIKMKDVCLKYNVKLLTYGTYCGGFLSDKYLGAPDPRNSPSSLTPSQRKYYNMIAAWGGWGLFQDLLKTLRGIADRHNVSIANVATRYILEKPYVGGVIVGARLGISSHIDDNLCVLNLNLTDQDRAEIEQVQKRSNRDQMINIIGTIPLYITSLNPGRCTGTMREYFLLRNPFRSVHAVALTNLGEAVGGLAVLTWIESLGGGYKAIVTQLRSEFSKKAKGKLVGTCTAFSGVAAAGEVGEKVPELLAEGVEEGKITVCTDIKDASGEVVCKVYADWSVRRSASKRKSS
ncbi:hypothetical protein HK102_000146 [Quaeritorhiza haematococci]|nr:hypothetical protein HK102_000146 [Quaeritorhiza haematococci]